MIRNPKCPRRNRTSLVQRITPPLALLVCILTIQTPIASRTWDQENSAHPLKLITPELIQPVIVKLSADELEGRGAGYPGEKKAAEFIAAEFKRLGLKPAGDRGRRSYFQEFKFHPHHPVDPWKTLTSRNVLGYVEGEDPALKQEIIVIGAHYDGQGRLGQADPFRFPALDPKDKDDPIWNSANDNATGVSAMLAAARAISQQQVKTKRSILFVAFGSEEHGMAGSIEYVTHPSFQLNKHVAMINFEKLGRTSQKPLTVGSSGTSAGWSGVLKNASTLTGTQVRAPVPFVIPDSDHYPFAASGIPSIMLSVSGPDDAHRPTDVADNIDYRQVAEYARFGLAVVLELANQPARMEYADVRGMDPGLIAHLASDQEADSAGLKAPDTGLKVTGIIPGGAGDRAGLKAGDLIVKAAEISFRRDMPLQELQKMQMEFVTGKRGVQLPMTILRGKEKLELTIDLRRPSQ